MFSFRLKELRGAALPRSQLGQLPGVLDDVYFRNYIIPMQIDFDREKRDKTLMERGLDFARAGEVFAGRHLTAEDTREDYCELRFLTVGKLDGRMVVMVWTPRGETRRIISMRKANEREIARYSERMD